MKKIDGYMGSFMDFRDNVLKALEEARHSKLIGKSLEAKVTVYQMNKFVN